MQFHETEGVGGESLWRRAASDGGCSATDQRLSSGTISWTLIEEGNPEIMEVVECTELKIPDINEEQYWESNEGKNPELNAIPALQK